MVPWFLPCCVDSGVAILVVEKPSGSVPCLRFGGGGDSTRKPRRLSHFSPVADLHWFPFFAGDWLSSPAILDMKPEQEGAYIRLLASAWGKGDKEPSLPADSVSLARRSRLGARWGKLGPLVREQFEERDGRLYNTKLSDIWHDQQAKHRLAVLNGKKGAAKKKGAFSHPQATHPATLPAEGPADRQQSELEPEERLMAPTEPISTFPQEALGVETPRPAELPTERGVRDGSATSVADVLKILNPRRYALRERPT